MVHSRSPSWLTPAASPDGFSTDAHHHGSFTTAARGGLTPTPACRCRRTYLHLCNSMVTVDRSVFYIRTSPAPFRTHQRRRRIILRNLQKRTHPHPAVARSHRSPPAHIPLDRRILQSTTPTLHTEILDTHRIRARI